MKAPLWKTWIVAFRKSTDSCVRLLFTGTGYEVICQCEGIKKNGFKVRIVCDVCIGYLGD